MKYDVEILDKSFLRINTYIADTIKTAKVTFFADDGSIKEVVEYGYKPPEEIQKAIDTKEDLNLSFCFVGDINFENCELPAILAEGAFFGGDVNFREATFCDIIHFEEATFNGKMDFTKALFSGQTCFGNAIFNNEASFQGATFSGMTDFGFVNFNCIAVFQEALFDNSVYFSETKFYGMGHFWEAKFNGEANFLGATFNHMTFHGATFSGEVVLWAVNFNDRAEFEEATFYGKTEFGLAQFNDWAEFQKTKFYDEVDFGAASFKKRSDFHEAVFSSKAQFVAAKFSGEVDFKSVIFSNNAILLGAKFDSEVCFFQAIFNGKTDFWKVTFNGEVNFGLVTFNNEAIFKEAVFSGKALFHYVIFSGKVEFGEAIFSGEANFHYAKFRSDAIFRQAAFNDKAIFSDATFNNEAEFRYVTFSNEVNFQKATFNGEADYDSVAIDSNILFESVKFRLNVNFNFQKCEELILANCIFEKSCDVSNKIKFKCFFIGDCKSLGSFSLHFDDHLKNAIYNFMSTERDKAKGKNNIDYKAIAQEFNFLKVNYNRNGEYNYEDQAYVEHRRCMRKVKNPIIHFLDWFFLDLISCYCTKPFHVFYAALVAIAVFAGLYNIPGTVDFTGHYQGFWGSIYHSVITFFTIGYGDSSPMGWLGLPLTGLEGFVGVFLMSLFTVSFVRKVLR